MKSLDTDQNERIVYIGMVEYKYYFNLRTELCERNHPLLVEPADDIEIVYVKVMTFFIQEMSGKVCKFPIKALN